MPVRLSRQFIPFSETLSSCTPPTKTRPFEASKSYPLPNCTVSLGKNRHFKTSLRELSWALLKPFPLAFFHSHYTI